MALFSKGCVTSSSFNKSLLNIVKYEVLFHRSIVKRKYPFNPEDEQKLPGMAFNFWTVAWAFAQYKLYLERYVECRFIRTLGICSIELHHSFSIE